DEGIQDQILTKLASVADLKVISRISTEKCGSKPRDLRSVSKELGVATVLQGTVQKDGERVRVNVELIDARSDRRIWTKNYDSDLRDVFAIQSEISQEIGNALRAKLSASEAVVLAAAATRDPEAYDLFLRGEYEQRRGESLTNAEPLDRAADVYRRMGQWERSLVEMARAEELDPRDEAIPANIAASYVNLRQWNDAKRAASRSLTLHPHNQVGLRNLFLSCVNGDGRTDAARRVIGSLPSGVTLTTNAVRGSVSNIIEDFSYLQVLERDFA